ncbi:hypothetical protein OG599_35240 (plasmid) [Streptomyces sp. NBC_01335]|uniref:hypothetical protein n=1 Tax=Streptomyces sp. NBC_01335 TaxID=2903828 RepID=UPI002E152CE3|nr:hypothetical protein OG599_35240 [Streptomyces sp. NBC_01335]
MQPVLVDLYAAATATGIDVRALRKRLSRGTLVHYGYDRAGRALVDLNQLIKPLLAEAA